MSVDLATFGGVKAGDIVAMRGHPGTRYLVEDKTAEHVYLRRLRISGGDIWGGTVLDPRQFDAMSLRVVTLGGD